MRPGERGVLLEYKTTALHLHLLVLGVTPGTMIRMVRRMPLRGGMYVLAGSRAFILRHSEADQLQVVNSE